MTVIAYASMKTSSTRPPQAWLRAGAIEAEGTGGQRTWTAWAILAYDLDTFTVLAR